MGEAERDTPSGVPTRRAPRGFVPLAAAAAASLGAGLVVGFFWDDLFLVDAMVWLPVGALLALGLVVYAMIRAASEWRRARRAAAAALLMVGLSFAPAHLAGVQLGVRGAFEWLIFQHERDMAGGLAQRGDSKLLEISGWGGINNFFFYDPDPAHAAMKDACGHEGTVIRGAYRLCTR
jgi:hypothetical protein